MVNTFVGVRLMLYDYVATADLLVLLTQGIDFARAVKDTNFFSGRIASFFLFYALIIFLQPP